MGVEEYNVELERRLNNAVTEVSTLRETVNRMQDEFSDFKRGQKEILDAVNSMKSDAATAKALLDYQVDSRIDRKLEPVYAELKKRHDESIRYTAWFTAAVFVGTIFGPTIVKLFGWS